MPPLQFPQHRSARKVSQPIPLIEELLGLRISILYIHTSAPVEKSRDVNWSLLFGYWCAKALLQATHTVVFRADLEPLHPKQVEVLCKFSAGGFLAGEFFYFWPSRGFPYRDLAYTSTQRKLAARLVGGVWDDDDCSVNTFSAYFHTYRHYKLLGGDERWREVKSPYDA